jgi:pimeloyl-ACP methyl ester carboxylesterase
MLRFSCVLAVVVLLVPPAGANDSAGTDASGLWVGRCRVGGKEVFLRLQLRAEAGGTTGTAFSRLLGVRNAPVSSTRARPLELSFPTPRGTVALSCQLREVRLEGTAEHGGATGPCAFVRRHPMDAATFAAFRGNYQLAPDRVVFVCGMYDYGNATFIVDGDLRAQILPTGPQEFLADDLRTIRFEVDRSGTVVAAIVSRPGERPRRAPRIQPYKEEPVTFSNGDVRLAGMLLLPAGPGPHPALVFVHGSGNGTRGQYPGEADRFARHGIAVLAFDKRGCGGSTGDWRKADFDELAGDVLAAVGHLRQDRRIRADRIGLWGVSQAGWVIPLAASRSSEVAFIVPISGGAVTPAEQELWRQRQNLEFLGVPERFLELERKTALVGYDWERLNRLGRMPIPQPFQDDRLNMFHDAPAVLRRVRQPVLAIFGGLDTLTPPRESAALWADALRKRGNDDYSVRLFARGSHGLFDGGKTGSPLELLPELRWVPGYFDTMVKWVRHHAGGPAFPEARQVDVDADAIPIESRGMDHVCWYGSGAVQPWCLLLSLVVYGSAVLTAPAGWVWRRWRHGRGAPEEGPRRTQWLAALLGLLNIAIMSAMTYVLYQLVMAVPHPVITRLGLIWNGLAAATWLSLILVVLVCGGCIGAWRHGWWTRAARAYYTVVALAGLAWVPFVVYWELAIPAW